MFFPYSNKKVIKLLCERNDVKNIDGEHYDSIILVFESSSYILIENDYDYDEFIIREIETIPSNIDYIVYYPTFSENKKLLGAWVSSSIEECKDLLLLGIGEYFPNLAIYSSCTGLEIFEINMKKL